MTANNHVFVTYLRLFLSFLKAFRILFIQFPNSDSQAKRIAIQRWSADTLSLLGIKVEVIGQLDTSSPQTCRMLVSNHVSWLDPLVIQTLQHSIFVAKQEVSQWPVVGPLTQKCGVIFVNRGSPSSTRKMVQSMSQALDQYGCVAGFPEGTSSEGYEVGLFHANLFEVAITNSCEVIALTLRYKNQATQAMSLEPAFVGDIGFLASLHRVICAPPIVVQIVVSNPIKPDGLNRRSLAQLAHVKVQSQLALLD
jgi:1-acyl-sn-glycerol-3-phosphate acyltransferase